MFLVRRITRNDWKKNYFFFISIQGPDQEVDWIELKKILDHSMRDGKIELFSQSKHKHVSVEFVELFHKNLEKSFIY
jgi:uncharacterized protein YrzB (UPF0473 family)